MHVLLSFLKWGSIGYSLGIVQWNFTRRDHPGNPWRVSGSGLVKSSVVPSKRSVLTTDLMTLTIFGSNPRVNYD